MFEGVKCVMCPTIMVYDKYGLGFVWVANIAHLLAFGTCSRFVMWARLSRLHWLESVCLRDPNILSMLCGKWYCGRFMGHLSGLEK